MCCQKQCRQCEPQASSACVLLTSCSYITRLLWQQCYSVVHQAQFVAHSCCHTVFTNAVHVLLLPQVAEGRAKDYSAQHILEAQRILAQPYTSSGEPSNGRMTMLRVRRAEPEVPRHSATGAAATGANGAAAAANAVGGIAAAIGTPAADAAAAGATIAAGTTGVAAVSDADAAGATAAAAAAAGTASKGAAAASADTPVAAAAAIAAAHSTDHSERADSAPRSAIAAAHAPSDTVADMLREMVYRCDTALLRRWIQAADFGVTFVLQLPRPVPAQNLLCMLSKLAEEHNSRGDRPSAQLIHYVIQQLKVAQAACAQRATAGSVRQTEPETEPRAEPISAASVSKEWVLLQRNAQLSTEMLKEVRSLRHAVLVHAALCTITASAHHC
jgi:hypothetical protein